MIWVGSTDRFGFAGDMWVVFGELLDRHSWRKYSYKITRSSKLQR